MTTMTKRLRNGYLSTRIAHYRYISWLWILRENAIIRKLIENYEKVPKGTPTKMLVGLLVKCKPLRMLWLKFEKRMLKNVYCPTSNMIPTNSQDSIQIYNSTLARMQEDSLI